MFTSLYVKTNYSLLSSLVSIDNLILYAVEHKLSALAICDDNMTSTKIFYDKCIKNNIKPIIGLDLKYNNSNILMYAKSFTGYQSLIKLSTILSERDITITDLETYNNDVVVVLPYKDFALYNELTRLYDNLYIGVLNKTEEKESYKVTKNVVFINKVLYLNKKHEKYLKYLFMIRDSKTIADDVTFKDNYNYMLLSDAISLVSNETLNNTNVIADMCNLELSKRDDLLPVYDTNIDSDQYIVKLSVAGLNKRLGGNVSDVYKKRLIYELDVIKRMGFSNYFLVVYDFIKYAKKNNILVGPGRGSAAGSLVAYSLGITEIDPIKYDLLFERFLNPERVSMPDIDTDFPDIYRNNIIEYVRNKYGEKRVSGIITFGTMAAKLVLRDVGRVLNIPPKTIDTLCKKIPTVTKDKLKDFYNRDENFRNIINSSDKLMLLYEISTLIEGFPRHISTHAAGVVMSRIDLDRIIPLVRNDDIYISGYTMEYLEELGLLKMDFLGIKNLTTIMNIIADIESSLGIKINFSDIPLDDPDALKLFETADTCGIFQFESEGMKNFLRKLKPNTIYDIFAAIALFRPGPAVNIDSYIRRKHGLEQVTYLDPSLEGILSSTYGIIIYQEQIMQIANVMAGFSYGEADILRRAMSKKKLDLLKGEEIRFIEGSVTRGHKEEDAKRVFDLILNFANYGFNKSHSVSYAIVAYKMAYLKAKYPKFFFSNLLSSVIGSEVKTIEYINEARKLGINVILPDINRSTNKYEVVDNGILFPLSNIKNVGIVTCKDIINSRGDGFSDIYDCFSKILSRNVNKSTLEALIDVSCFDSFGYNKKTLYYNLDNLINYATLTKDLDPDLVIKPDIEIMDEFSKGELLSNEKASLGFYLSSHPTTIYKSRTSNVVNLVDIKNYFGKRIELLVMIDKVRVVNTKNNDRMAFYLASDDTAQTDLTLFPKAYEKYKDIDKGEIVLVKGEVQRRFDKYQIIVNEIKRIND